DALEGAPVRQERIDRPSNVTEGFIGQKLVGFEREVSVHEIAEPGGRNSHVTCSNIEPQSEQLAGKPVIVTKDARVSELVDKLAVEDIIERPGGSVLRKSSPHVEAARKILPTIGPVAVVPFHPQDNPGGKRTASKHGVPH